MSALGHKRTNFGISGQCLLYPPKTDILHHGVNVCFVPFPGQLYCNNIDIAFFVRHIAIVGPYCSRPAYPRHIAQALQLARSSGRDFWRYVQSPQAFRPQAALEPGPSTTAR